MFVSPLVPPCVGLFVLVPAAAAAVSAWSGPFPVLQKHNGLCVLPPLAVVMVTPAHVLWCCSMLPCSMPAVEANGSWHDKVFLVLLGHSMAAALSAAPVHGVFLLAGLCSQLREFLGMCSMRACCFANVSIPSVITG